MDGAVEAFTTAAVWVTSSKASKDDPQASVIAVGGGQLNAADAAMLRAMDHAELAEFNPAQGCYRVLGFSGASQTPDSVMVEIVGVARGKSHSRWLRVGGVVTWDGGKWAVTSIRPREIPGAENVSADEPVETLAIAGEAGWRMFGDRS